MVEEDATDFRPHLCQVRMLLVSQSESGSSLLIFGRCFWSLVMDSLNVVREMI
jgi:hypothetical protein